MKKILVIGLISSLFSAGAFAAACTATTTVSVNPTINAGSATAPVTGEQCVCDGGVSGRSTVNGGVGTVITTPLFIKSGFDVQCSASTIVSYNEVSANGFAVASGSKKGNRTFRGSSSGGGITESAVCTATGCTGADVSTANGLATTAAGS